MKKFLKQVFDILISKTFLTAVLIIIQIVYIVLTIIKFAELRVWLDTALKLLSLFMSLMIIRRDESSSYKVVWIFTMGLLPVLGGLMYLFIGNRRPARKLRRTLDKSIAHCARSLEQDITVTEQLPMRVRSLCGYIGRYGGYPVCSRSSVKYFPYGEDFFGVFLEELEKAEKFIFLEYFMIFKGKMWDDVYEILGRKAAEGVDIRIIYDDVGSMTYLPKPLKKNHIPDGIKVVKFNPFIPLFSVVMNHRDHRKIAVIDGLTAFTGGINISDEYINVTHPFGRWKDTAVMIKGDAVFNLTVMFAGMWNAFSGDAIDCRSHLPDSVPHIEDNGLFVQPFCDSPLDNEQVSETIYADLLMQAERYVYIFTPYLIIDERMHFALTSAAKRGVDVRIVTPGIPDKKLVFRITRSYYESLMAAGVRIYEYTPGFIHAKSYICDDKAAVVGSINMDFRSLYLHFECGAFIYSDSENGSEVIGDIYNDCIETFAVSREIKHSESHKFSKTLTDSVLRVFSPLI